MIDAAKIKKKKIEKLFLKAQVHNIINFKNRFLSTKLKFKSPYEKIYLLKKLYSILYCLKENNLLKDNIHPDLKKLLKKSARIYFYFFLEMQTDFHKINRHFLLLLLCKHLSLLLKKILIRSKPPKLFSLKRRFKILFKKQTQHDIEMTPEQKLAILVEKFSSSKMIIVSNTTILSGHDTTINTILTFLQSEPFNINKGYKRLKKFINYPPQFGSSLGFQLEPCSLCPSKFRVNIKYDFKEIVPFFCRRKSGCDLLQFLDYIDKVEDFNFQSKENEFYMKKLDTEF
jgi:hypothetical protein